MRSYKTLRKYALAGAHGKDWYALAELSIRRHCNSLGFDVQTYVDVLAITSPRVNVRKNVQLTNAYMTTRKRIRNAPRPGIGTATGPSFAPYLVHRQVAGLMTTIRSGLEHYELTGEIRGPKTSAFARALLGDGDAIVLDVWMARALDVEQATLATRKVREPCEDLVRKVARSLGWAPAQVQAAVWTHWYEDRGRVGTTTAVGVDTVLNTL